MLGWWSGWVGRGWVVGVALVKFPSGFVLLLIVQLIEKSICFHNFSGRPGLQFSLVLGISNGFGLYPQCPGL